MMENNPREISSEPLNSIVLLSTFFLFVFHSSKIRAEGNKLHFDEVSLEEDGMYQCVARNSIGMIVSSSWVHILSK